MNRRQLEKKYKRKWRQLFSAMYNEMGIRIKPSRIRLKSGQNENEFIVKGSGNGYVLKLKLTAKEGKDERSKEM